MERLRVLILEDQPDDAELMASELRHAGYDVLWQRVETAGEFRQAIAQAGSPEPILDLILAGHPLPNYDGLSALHEVKQRRLDIPFILVASTGGEEVAARAEKLGAEVFLQKNHLDRLGHLVRNTLEKERMRPKGRQPAPTLEESEERFRRLTENALDIIFCYRLTPTPGFDYISPAVEAITGYKQEIFYSDPGFIFGIAHPEDLKTAHEVLAGGCSGAKPLTIRWKHRNGGTIWTEQHVVVIRDESGNCLAVEGAVRDISERKQAEQALHEVTEQTEHRLQRLTALRAIDTAITTSLDVRLTLKILLDQVTSILGAHAGAILLFNPSMNSLEFAAGRGFQSNAVRNTRLLLGQDLAGQAALKRRSVKVTDISQDLEAFARKDLLANEGFKSYFALPLISKGKVKGVLEVFHRSPLDPDTEWMEFLEALAAQAAIAIDNAELFENLQTSNTELALAYDATLEGWVRALDLRDNATEGHTLRVTEMALTLAGEMGFDQAQLAHLRRGALLHDIGKMGIPDSILFKQSPLTEQEWEIMQRHPVYAYELLSPVPFLQPALDIPYCHHERWDGSGYPRGLKGEEIPLAARIFAVVDVWDALRTERPYEEAWPDDKIKDYLMANSGKQFDSQVVEAFLRVLEVKKEIQHEKSDQV